MTSSKDTGRSNLLWIADLEECEIGPDMKWTKGESHPSRFPDEKADRYISRE